MRRRRGRSRPVPPRGFPLLHDVLRGKLFNPIAESLVILYSTRMDAARFTEALKSRLSGYFNIESDACWEGGRFDFTAEFSARTNQTVLTKNRVMDYWETREILLFSVEERFSVERAVPALDFCRTTLASIVRPSRHHKSTSLVRVFAAASFASEEEKKALFSLVRRFRYSKAHRCMIHGFSEVGAVLVDLGGAVPRKKRAWGAPSAPIALSPAARRYGKLFTAVLADEACNDE